MEAEQEAGVQHAGGPTSCRWTASLRHRAPRIVPGMQPVGRHCRGAWTDMWLPFSWPEVQRVPTQTTPEVVPEVPHGGPTQTSFRLIFQGSYNLPLIPHGSGKTRTESEINTQVAHRSGSSNPLSRSHLPPT